MMNVVFVVVLVLLNHSVIVKETYSTVTVSVTVVKVLMNVVYVMEMVLQMMSVIVMVIF